MARPWVLVVDDNEQDLEMAGIAFGELGLGIEVVAEADSERALARLQALAADAGAALPALLVLDLNMPRLHGLDLLRAAKADGRLRAVPVVVLTTSDAPADRARCLALGAERYLVKPHRLAPYLQAIASLRAYFGDGGPRATRVAAAWSRWLTLLPRLGGGPSPA